ncbi:MAG: hypothetical protein K2N03_06515 [Muribaculaceae bacterium]|nr:hypothetical protein [Muribaculaceae bacterium]
MAGDRKIVKIRLPKISARNATPQTYSYSLSVRLLEIFCPHDCLCERVHLQTDVAGQVRVGGGSPRDMIRRRPSEHSSKSWAAGLNSSGSAT